MNDEKKKITEKALSEEEQERIEKEIYERLKTVGIEPEYVDTPFIAVSEIAD